MTPVICLHNERTQIEIGDWDGNDFIGLKINSGSIIQIKSDFAYLLIDLKKLNTKL